MTTIVVYKNGSQAEPIYHGEEFCVGDAIVDALLAGDTSIRVPTKWISNVSRIGHAPSAKVDTWPVSRLQQIDRIDTYRERSKPPVWSFGPRFRRCDMCSAVEGEKHYKNCTKYLPPTTPSA